MKNRKKTLLAIIISVGLLLIIVGIILDQFTLSKNNENETPKNESSSNEQTKDETTNSEEDLMIHYICTKGKEEAEFATVEYLYEFDYLYTSVMNGEQKISFTFKQKDWYQNSDVENSFQTQKPDKIELDDKNLTQTFIWTTLIPQTEEQQSIEDYVKVVETYGYNCQIAEVQ